MFRREGEEGELGHVTEEVEVRGVGGGTVYEGSAGTAGSCDYHLHHEIKS